MLRIGRPPAAALLLAGILTPIGQAELRRADAVARSSDAERQRFHAAYIFDHPSSSSTETLAVVERIEVVTEFRRAVMAGESRLRLGDHMFGLAVLEHAVAPWRGRLAIRADLKFHPQNVLISVPAYEIVLGTGGADLVEPIDTTRAPVYALLGKDEKGGPLAGATVEASFDAARLDGSAWPVRVREPAPEGAGGHDRDVASVSVDFGRLQ